jgi:hypothetical protein
MIAQPSTQAIKSADFDVLDALEQDAQRLGDAGQLDVAAFDALWKRGLDASKGNVALLQTLAMFRPGGQVRRDFDESKVTRDPLGRLIAS